MWNCSKLCVKLTDVWWKEFLLGEDCRAEDVVGDSISEELGLQGTCKQRLQLAFHSLLNKTSNLFKCLAKEHKN